MVHILPSSLGDPSLLAPYLREADKQEIEAATHLTPHEVLYVGYHHGDPCMSMIDDCGKVIGMFGVIPMPLQGSARTGVIWCLTANEALDHKKELLRRSKDILKELTKDYNMVFNYIYHKNTVHIRWVKHMGFTVAEKPTKFGYQEELFHYFEKAITDV